MFLGCLWMNDFGILETTSKEIIIFIKFISDKNFTRFTTLIVGKTNDLI